MPLYLIFCLNETEERHRCNEMTGIYQWSDSEVTAMPTVMIVWRAGVGKTTLNHYSFKEAYGGSSKATPITAFEIIVPGEKNEESFMNRTIIADDLNFYHIK
uniref:Crinkler (CRN) n=1 Tax=Rhabditophanes sp. KR3021 TaxID=114890 RepID=A0AC35UF60_9BILA